MQDLIIYTLKLLDFFKYRKVTPIYLCINYFTRWPEALPIPDMTAPTVEQAFVSGGISHFGVPSTITTDRGHQFESALWQQLMQLLECK